MARHCLFIIFKFVNFGLVKEAITDVKIIGVHFFRDQSEWNIVPPADVILFEGILPFYFKEIRHLFNMKLFVDTDADTRLSRRCMNLVQLSKIRK